MKRRHTRSRTRHQHAPKRGFGMRHLVLAAAILLPTITASAGLQSSPPDPVAPPSDVPLRGPGRTLVDGAKNPELIDRDLLVASILGSKAMPASPSERGAGPSFVCETTRSGARGHADSAAGDDSVACGYGAYPSAFANPQEWCPAGRPVCVPASEASGLRPSPRIIERGRPTEAGRVHRSAEAKYKDRHWE